MRTAGDIKTALFLCADPPSPRDRAEQASAEAEAALLAALADAAAPPRLSFRAAHGVTTDDLIALLLAHRPALLHLCAGADEAGLLLRDRQGQPASVSGAALAELVAAIPELRCVVLGGSGTAALAADLLGVLGAVIAVDGPIDDETRRAFSQGLYTALLAGESLERAARLARVQALLLGRADAERLVLLQRSAEDGALILCPPPG